LKSFTARTAMEVGKYKEEEMKDENEEYGR
jgi:hypothetical protein